MQKDNSYIENEDIAYDAGIRLLLKEFGCQGELHQNIKGHNSDK
jgi:hypothetical protein